jgi:hypothetical protein
MIIGMKFAILEMKVALIKIINNFQICKSKNTVENLEFCETGVVRRPLDGISLLFKKRT